MERLLLGGSAPLDGPRLGRKYWGVTLREGPRGRLRACLYFALVLVLVSATVQRERFGIPVELDAPAVFLLALLAFLLAPASVLRFWTLPLILPLTGFVLAGYASCLANSAHLSEVVRSGAPLLSICVRQSAVLTYRVIMFYAVVIAVSNLPELRRKPPIVMLALLLIQAIVCLALLAQYPSPVSQLVIRGEQFGPGSLAFMGLFLEPNLFGIYAVTTIALWMPLSLAMGKKSALSWTLVCMQVGIVAVFMSYTRSTWLALVGVLCLLTIGAWAGLDVGGKRKRSVLLVLGIMVVVGFALSSAIALVASQEQPSSELAETPSSGLVTTRSSELVETPSPELVETPSPGLDEGPSSALVERALRIVEYQTGSSGAGRIWVWTLALEEWAHKPWLGWGLLSFQPSGGPSTQGWLYSSLVQTLHDTGVVGLIFMLWLCVGVAVYTWRAFMLAGSRIDRGLALGYLMAQAALFFTSQFSSFFWGAPTWTLFGLAVGYRLLAPAGKPASRLRPLRGCVEATKSAQEPGRCPPAPPFEDVDDG
jgi:hypothetical protein